MSKKNYKKSRKYKKMRRRKIIFGIEITVLLNSFRNSVRLRMDQPFDG